MVFRYFDDSAVAWRVVLCVDVGFDLSERISSFQQIAKRFGFLDPKEVSLLLALNGQQHNISVVKQKGQLFAPVCHFDHQFCPNLPQPKSMVVAVVNRFSTQVKP